MKIEKLGFTDWLKDQDFEGILFDIDGTIVVGNNPMTGAKELLDYLRSSQTGFKFLTNDGSHSPEEKADIMAEGHVIVDKDEIITCSSVIADYAKKHNLINNKVFIFGDLGIPNYAELAGLEVETDILKLENCSGIIISEGEYNWLENITAAVNFYMHNPNRYLIIPNPDSYWPAEKKGYIGIGSGGIARFITTILDEAKVHIKPIYLGKPYSGIFDYAIEKLENETGTLNRNKIIMLGDSVRSDILGANNAQLQSGLILSGITDLHHLEDLEEEFHPNYIFNHL